MVRCIKSCSACGLRFVSHGGTASNLTSILTSTSNRSTGTQHCPGCSVEQESKTVDNNNNNNSGSETTTTIINVNTNTSNDDIRALTSMTSRTTEEPVPKANEGSDLGDEDYIDLCDSGDGDGDGEFQCKTIAKDSTNPTTTATATTATTTTTSTGSNETAEENTERNVRNESRNEPPKTTGLNDSNSNSSNSSSNNNNNSNNSNDICFICGTSLSRLKRRIDHIKRCSKKHGITGRDVRLVRSNAEGSNSHALSPGPSGSVTIEPTGVAAADTDASRTGDDNKDKDEDQGWHGDSEQLLKLTNQNQSEIKLLAVSSSYSSFSSRSQAVAREEPQPDPEPSHPVPVVGYDAKRGKFIAPMATRNLNNVLMAGSRRLEVVAKTAEKREEILQQKQRGNNNNNNINKKRPRYNNREGREHWSCPAYKKITGTDFVVDGFYYAKPSLTRNYFLSHFHADHYGGIASSWDHGTIYCSLATASLVSQQLGVDKKYLHPLPMNVPTVIESRGKAVTVTLLDANHCPGAVMFFFEVGKRTILHVGDFRWSRDVMLRGDADTDANADTDTDAAISSFSSPLERIASQQVALDELYLDTTYCDEKYRLPGQEATIQATIETFEKELERCRNSSSSSSSNSTSKAGTPLKKRRTLHLFGAYTIGKEKIWVSVAKHFGRKVYVDKARHRVLSALNLPEDCTKLLTTNKDQSSLWVVPMGHLNMKKLPEYFGIANSKPFAPAYDRIVGYRPTGWSLSRSGIINTRTSGNLAIHSVPYSEHSSFPELVDCLACLRPAKIIPTVQASKSAEQVKRLLQALRQTQTALKLFSKKQTIEIIPVDADANANSISKIR